MERVGYSEEHYNSRLNLKETNDCTVMAWVNCFDCSYEAAHIWMHRFGRNARRGMTLKQIEAALKGCRKAKVRFGPYGKEEKGITLNQFVKKHPVGRYYVTVRGHALCIKDGVLYDFKESKRRIVDFAARVYLEGEI